MTLSLTSVLLLATFATQADTENNLENDQNSIERVIVTASRSATPIKQLSASTDSISSEALNKVSPEHIQQALNRVAGVNIDRNSGQEMLLAIRSPVLTGAGACGSFLTLENGIALRPSGFCNVNELFESHYENAQRIEIIKGPSSAFYGNSGLHGVINVINPADINRPSALSATLGKWDYQQLKLNASTEDFAIATSLSHSGGFRDNSGFNQQKLSLSHHSEFQQTEVSSFLTATHLDQDTAGYLVGKDNYKNVALSRENPNPEAYRKASSVRFSQRYEFLSGLQISPFIRYSEMEFLQHFVPGQPIENNRHVSIGTQSQKQFTLSDASELTLGADVEYANISLLEEQFEPTIGSDFLVATIPQGKHYDYLVDATTLAAFAQYQNQLNSHWAVTAGGRLESISFDYDNQMNSGRVDENGNECGFGGCRFNRPSDRSDDFLIFSPKLGAVYQASNSQSAYINLNHGFRAPQTTELYRLQRAQQVSNLKPEKLAGIEAGWRQTAILAERELLLNLEAYWYEKSNVILRDNDYFYVSNGKTEHKGMEVSVESELNKYLSLAANVAYANHTYRNNPNLSDSDIVGNVISNAPEFMANVFANMTFAKLSLELHGQFVDSYYLNPENTSSYAGHTIWHISGRYEYSPSTSVSLNIDNLFDKRYAERANYTSFTEERYFPGKPMNVRASVKYLF